MNATTQPGGPGHRFPPVISHDTRSEAHPGRLGTGPDSRRCTASPRCQPEAESSTRRAAVARSGRRELDEYFAGRSRVQRAGGPEPGGASPPRVLDYLAHVGYGRTSTYGALATALGLTEDGPPPGRGGDGPQPGADRRALPPGTRRRRETHRNAGGPGAKRWLLDLEGREHTPQLDLDLEPATRPGVAAMMP